MKTSSTTGAQQQPLSPRAGDSAAATQRSAGALSPTSAHSGASTGGTDLQHSAPQAPPPLPQPTVGDQSPRRSGGGGGSGSKRPSVPQLPALPGNTGLYAHVRAGTMYSPFDPRPTTAAQARTLPFTFFGASPRGGQQQAQPSLTVGGVQVTAGSLAAASSAAAPADGPTTARSQTPLGGSRPSFRSSRTVRHLVNTLSTCYRRKWILTDTVLFLIIFYVCRCRRVK